MPIFEIEANGQKYQVEASDEQALRSVIPMLAQQNPAQQSPQQWAQERSRSYAERVQPSALNDATTAAIAAIPFSDEIGSVGAAPIRAAVDWWGGEGFDLGRSYDREQALQQRLRDDAAQRSPIASLAGSVAGSVALGGGAAKAGASVLGRVAETAPLWMRAGAAAADGALAGGISGLGEGEGTDRLGNAVTGAVVGGAAGGAMPLAVSAAGGAYDAVRGALGAGNQNRANDALVRALRRSGQKPEEVTGKITQAAQEGADEYMLADALGTPGQRLLNSVARSPGEGSQKVTEALLRRQSGQGDRLIGALSEGFDAPVTPAQRQAALEGWRSTTAKLNYDAARGSAGVVDPTQAIKIADDFLKPGAMKVMSNQTGISDDSIESAIRKSRGYLTDGKSILTDFDAAFRAKRELDNIIEKSTPTIQRQIIPIRNALDDSLANTSQQYAAARDTFRAQSKEIEALELGRSAQTPRARPEDNISSYERLNPNERSAFRVGYVDPLIAKIENTRISPTTNAAASLITNRTGKEFPVFAAPGRADVMGNRIAREQEMFQTASRALGGSNTANNLADLADVNTVDASLITQALTGNISGALRNLTGKVSPLLTGENEQTRALIAQALMQTSPTKANAALLAAVQRGDKLTAQQRAIIQALTTISASGGGRAFAD